MTTATSPATTSASATSGDCGCGCGGSCGMASDPFTSVHYHYGMLLGVDDFETEQGYHRGKMRLHNGWAHGAGVLWGLGVEVDEDRAEIRVLPGVALDWPGHELHLAAPACVSVPAWAEANLAGSDGTLPAELTFTARVEARFATCESRPVPSLAATCEGAGSATECSRTIEQIGLRLVQDAGDRDPVRYRLLRILYGLLEPDAGKDDEHRAAKLRAIVLATPAGSAARATAVLDAFHQLAALDTAALAPPTPTDDEAETIEPAVDGTPVLLANVSNLKLTRGASGWKLSGGTVDLSVRPSLVATETIQELTAAALLCCDGVSEATPVLPGRPGRPLRPGKDPIEAVANDGTKLTLRSSEPLDRRTVQPAAFRVTALGAKGWEEIPVEKASYRKGTRTIALQLASAPAPPWRVQMAGTGLTPVLTEHLTPLGDGSDFVHMEA